MGKVKIILFNIILHRNVHKLSILTIFHFPIDFFSVALYNKNCRKLLHFTLHRCIKLPKRGA